MTANVGEYGNFNYFCDIYITQVLTLNIFAFRYYSHLTNLSLLFCYSLFENAGPVINIVKKASL